MLHEGILVSKPEVLVADLDGSLLRSDMLFESFWSALGNDWRSPFLMAVALVGGRARLKRDLAMRSSVDVSTLPYDSGRCFYKSLA